MTNKTIGVALLVMTLAGSTMGQNNIPEKKPVVQQGPAVTIPLSTGTAINASLLGSLDSEKSKPGDLVNAIVTESVVYQRSVLLPKGSRIVGHVVRTGAGSDGDRGAALFVEFDRVVLKNGETAELNAGIQALAPVGAQATIPSREKYEESRLDGTLRPNSSIGTPENPGNTVVPSTYTVPRRTEVMPALPSTAAGIEGGLDRKGLFTPDSKGAFSEPNLRVFTPVSEGSHGTVLVGAKQNIHLENGTHLLIVVQPPAPAPDAH
jgi:hypothetical protein